MIAAARFPLSSDLAEPALTAKSRTSSSARPEYSWPRPGFFETGPAHLHCTRRADAFLVTHRFCSDVTARLCLRRDPARLRRSGRPCHPPESDLCSAPRCSKLHGRGLHVFLLDRQCVRRRSCHPDVCARWGWCAVSQLGASISAAALILGFLTRALSTSSPSHQARQC